MSTSETFLADTRSRSRGAVQTNTIRTVPIDTNTPQKSYSKMCISMKRVCMLSKPVAAESGGKMLASALGTHTLMDSCMLREASRCLRL